MEKKRSDAGNQDFDKCFDAVKSSLDSFCGRYKSSQNTAKSSHDWETGFQGFSMTGRQVELNLCLKACYS